MEQTDKYSRELEILLSNSLPCERHLGFGSILNSDFIQDQPFIAIFSTLAHKYATSNSQEQQQINDFINTFFFYARNNLSLDQWLSFDQSAKTINGTKIAIKFDNGEELIKRIISKLREIL